MKKELTLTGITLLLQLALFGGLLAFAAYDYWAFVDWLALPPVSPFGVPDPENINIILYLLTEYMATARGYVVDAMIWAGGYDLMPLLKIIVSIILLLSIGDYFLGRSMYSLISAGLSAGLLLFSLMPVTAVSKMDVDRVLVNLNTDDVYEVDSIRLLRHHEFRSLDEHMHRVEEDFRSGRINEFQYRNEYNELNDLKKEDAPLLDQWIETSRYPAIAYTARGTLDFMLGWKARGQKYAHETSEKQFADMRKHFDRAMEDLNKAIALDEYRLYAYTLIINMAGAHGDDAEAEQAYLDGKRLFPASYLLPFSRFNKLQPKWGGSVEDMRRIVRDARNRAEKNAFLISLGNRELWYEADDAWNDERYQDALAKYRRALLYAPNHDLLVSVYSVYNKLEEYENAADSMSVCLEYYPENIKCRLYRATAHAHAYEWNKAKQDLEAVEKADIQKARDMELAGWAYEKMSKHEKAGQYYMQASDTDPTNTTLLERIYSLSYYGHISLQQATPYMKRWTQIRPNDPVVWLRYADTIEDYDPQGALPLYRKYLALVDHVDNGNEKSIAYARAQIESITNTGK